MKIESARAFSLLLMALTLAACASVEPPINPIRPTVKFVDAQVANIDFHQTDLIFNVAVANRNPFPVRLPDIHYDFKIEGNSLVNQVVKKDLTIGPSAVGRIVLPVTFRYGDLVKLPRNLWEMDKVDYQFDSNIHVELPVAGIQALPFRKTGELSIPRLPSVKLEDIVIINQGLTTAEVVALVTIMNPNGFNINLNAVNYQLRINQSSWGEGARATPASIPGKGVGEVLLPLTVDLLGAGKSTFQEFSDGSPLDYQLVGELTLDTGIDYLRDYKMPINISGRATF